MLKSMRLLLALADESANDKKQFEHYIRAAAAVAKDVAPFIHPRLSTVEQSAVSRPNKTLVEVIGGLPVGSTPEKPGDMFEAEFTHEGDRCSFEVLLGHAGLTDPALQAIAEIVHDIDLKDGKFGWEEAGGIKALIDGVAMAHQRDEGRLTRGGAIFDDLYEYFSKKRVR
jgi:hypothetical protein